MTWANASWEGKGAGGCICLGAVPLGLGLQLHNAARRIQQQHARRQAGGGGEGMQGVGERGRGPAQFCKGDGPSSVAAAGFTA